jgi:small subunit ribosomal protein S4
MVKYLGPKLKIIRKLGVLPNLTQKINNKFTKLAVIKQLSISDDYKSNLIEKQKLRYNYLITEKQLLNYYLKAKKQVGATGSILLKLLESRLDSVLCRLGFASTILAARQYINHGHILVNNKKLTISSYLCKLNDCISVRDSLKSQTLIKKALVKIGAQQCLFNTRIQKINLFKHRFNFILPNYLFINKDLLEGKFIKFPNYKTIVLKINELKVIEYYTH